MPLRILAVFALLAVEALPQQAAGVGSLTGTVKDRDGTLPGAAVIVHIGAATRIVVTNEPGVFRMTDLPAGTYPAQVTCPGFVSVRGSVIITGGRVTTWDVTLSMQPFYARAASTGPDATPSELARGVYEAAVRRVQPPPTDLVIESVSMRPPILDEDEWTGGLAGVPQDLRTLLASPTSAQAVTLRAASFAPTASLMAFKEIEAGIAAARIRTSFVFTRVFASGDGLQALVGYRYYCGNICGEGTLLWLSRPTTRAEWIVRGQKTFFVS